MQFSDVSAKFTQIRETTTFFQKCENRVKFRIGLNLRVNYTEDRDETSLQLYQVPTDCLQNSFLDVLDYLKYSYTFSQKH